MRLTLPGKDGAVMDLGLIKLGGCAGKDGTGFALVVTMAVLMVEGYVADAGPAVLDDGVRCKLGHSVYGVRVFTKVLKSLRCSSENVGFWLVFCMFAPESYLNHND